MSKMMKFSLLSTAALFTSACALTEVVAITGLSYALTGKSITDNALSMVTNMDCATHHILSEGAVCLDKQQTLTALTDQAFMSFAPTEGLNYQSPIIPIQFKDRARDYGYSQQASIDTIEVVSKEEVTAADSKFYRVSQGTGYSAYEMSHSGTVTVDMESLLYAVVGSFTTEQNANLRKTAFESYSPKISKAAIDDGTLYRVVIGPLSYREQIADLPKIAEKETISPWIISLCPESLLEGPCREG